MGAWAVGAGLAAAWWLVSALAKKFSTGGAPERLLPALAAASALYGVAMLLDGGRFAAVSPRFERAFARAALVGSGAMVLAGALLVPVPRTVDLTMVIVALAACATLAVVLALRYRIGWPFYLAESALPAAYGYLRARTPWLDAFNDWDGVVACVGGFACLVIARQLRGARDGLGSAESRRMATLMPILSLAFLASSSDPRVAIGPAVAAGLYLVMARLGTGGLHGFLAALFANISVFRVWIEVGIQSPVAYALPAGTTLMLLARVYGRSLGEHAGAVRTLASLLIFGSTSYEVFRFREVWPAATLAAASVIVVLLGLRGRVRSYLYLGFASLLLDIVANLTRWGMRDRLIGGSLGVIGGSLLFGLGVMVARHKSGLLARYRDVRAWPW
jgi:hypothetical protein